MSAPIAYPIVTLNDMARIPRDRWPAFLADLTSIVNTIRATCEALDLAPGDLEPTRVEWTDDDAVGCALNITGPHDELLCTIQGGPDV